MQTPERPFTRRTEGVGRPPLTYTASAPSSLHPPVLALVCRVAFNTVAAEDSTDGHVPRPLAETFDQEVVPMLVECRVHAAIPTLTEGAPHSRAPATPLVRRCSTSGLNRHTNRLSGAPSASSIRVRSAHHQGQPPPAIKKRNRAGYSSTGRDRPSTPARSALRSRLDGSPRTGLLRLRRRPAF